MDLALIAIGGVVIWLSIVVGAIAMCRAASRADARTEGTAAEVAPVQRSDAPLGHAGIPAI